MLNIAEREDFNYADVDKLGQYTEDNTYNQKHIEAVKALKLADLTAIRERKFRVCVDTINSVGGVILPKLLDELGVEYKILYGEPTGDFAHNPNPSKRTSAASWKRCERAATTLESSLIQTSIASLSFRRTV